jgi:hypothetical protein
MLKLTIYDLLVNWHQVQNSEKARELYNSLWTHADYIQIKRYKECGTLPRVPSHQPPSSFCVMVMMSPFLNFSWTKKQNKHLNCVLWIHSKTDGILLSHLIIVGSFKFEDGSNPDRICRHFLYHWFSQLTNLLVHAFIWNNFNFK